MLNSRRNHSSCMLNHYAYVFYGQTNTIERLNAHKLSLAINEGTHNFYYEWQWWKVMLCDALANGINTLASPISSKEILIMGGGKTEAYIYDAINNTVKPQSQLQWQGGSLNGMECDANQCGVTRCKEVIGLVKNGQEELHLILYKPDDSYAEIVVNYGKTFKTMATPQKK